MARRGRRIGQASTLDNGKPKLRSTERDDDDDDLKDADGGVDPFTASAIRDCLGLPEDTPVTTEHMKLYIHSMHPEGEHIYFMRE